MVVALVGLANALVFFSVGPGATGHVVSGVCFLTLVVLAYFQRSVEQQIVRLDRENDELRVVRQRLDQENKAFDAANKRLSETQRRLASQNLAYLQENEEFDEANKRLAETQLRLEGQNVTFQRENEALAKTQCDLTNLLETERQGFEKKLAQLSKLHTESVAVIRQLALYGDECKGVGKNLSDIASNLHDTDRALGLSSGEIGKQVRALTAVAASLESSLRGKAQAAAK